MRSAHQQAEWKEPQARKDQVGQGQLGDAGLGTSWAGGPPTLDGWPFRRPSFAVSKAWEMTRPSSFPLDFRFLYPS